MLLIIITNRGPSGGSLTLYLRMLHHRTTHTNQLCSVLFPHYHNGGGLVSTSVVTGTATGVVAVGSQVRSTNVVLHPHHLERGISSCLLSNVVTRTW
jgi:hypothetical protein